MYSCYKVGILSISKFSLSVAPSLPLESKDVIEDQCLIVKMGGIWGIAKPSRQVCSYYGPLNY